ncbi:MAG: hypothetical protein R2860_02235 [Desulfobacterales bacterium]
MDGNEFVDYMCAYGPMVLGYCNDARTAAGRGIPKGSCMSAAPPVMVALAEKLVDTVGRLGLFCQKRKRCHHTLS